MTPDTICAIATAPGGALGIVRISGPEAHTSICRLLPAEKHFRVQDAHKGFFTTILDGSEILDEAVVSVYRAPHSYTGEDSVEISCHGSQYILQRLINLLLEAGLRVAEPGEFTKRAFLAGKLDLSQAEAVADLIASTNRASHKVAVSQLRGAFSSELSSLREELLHLTALLELELDFSDHEDLEFADRTELLSLTRRISDHIGHLADSFNLGQAIKEGIPVAIVGHTNVGKSTLLNCLLRDNRAIVSDVHGTTRDTIEDTIDIHGIKFRIIDTAGLRHTTDEIERIGIQRTYQAINRARIILYLFDTPEVPTTDPLDLSSPLAPSLQPRPLTPSSPSDPSLQTRPLTPSSPSDPSTPSPSAKKLLLVRTKSDLQPLPTHPLTPSNPSSPSTPIIPISAKTNQGIEALKEALYTAAEIPDLTESDVIITNARHYNALLRAEESLQRVLTALQTSLPSDLIAEDLRETLTHLAHITGGQITPTETLSHIFQSFCIGK